MDAREIRLRCIEAAARNPDPRHPDGFAAECATRWIATRNSASFAMSPPVFVFRSKRGKFELLTSSRTR